MPRRSPLSKSSALLLTVGTLVACLWAAPAAAQQSPNVDAPPEYGARFRIGLEVGAGLAFGDTAGAAVGLLGQLGAQVTDLFGVYYQPTLYFMGFADDASVDAQGIVGTSQGGMFVFDLSRFFELGAGAGYFFGSIGDCSTSSTDCTTGSFHGAVVNARMAFLIGFNLVRARIAIPISINSQTIFNGDQHITTLIAAIGLQRY